jgi:hypothetical protein
VKKNWLLLLFFPEFAMLRIPAASCLSLRPAFSSLNLPLKIESPPDPSPEARDDAEQHSQDLIASPRTASRLLWGMEVLSWHRNFLCNSAAAAAAAANQGPKP